jgi:hypothetical protein
MRIDQEVVRVDAGVGGPVLAAAEGFFRGSVRPEQEHRFTFVSSTSRRTDVTCKITQALEL